MKLKANLHFHSKEDPYDVIDYDLFEGIDKAAELGFNVLASTCHKKNICTEQHIAYAQRKDILLIPGIEANIYEEGSNRRNHVVILNCDTSADAIRTFGDLKKYRESHPAIFVIAAHPYFYGNFSLEERLEKYIDLFDAIEHSLFYTQWFDRNVRGARVAETYGKPFIATSDTHFFNFMNTSFVTIDVEEKTPRAIFSALREFKYKNTTSPRSLFDIFGTYAGWMIMEELQKTYRNIIKKPDVREEDTVPAPVTVEVEKDHE